MRKSWARVLPSLASLIAIQGHATSARAFDLDYAPPAGCPSKDWLREQLASVPGNERSDIHAQLHIEGAANSWTARLEIRSSLATDTRTLQGETCQAVVDASAVILSLAFAPPTAAAEPPAQPTPTRRVEPSPNKLPTVAIPAAPPEPTFAFGVSGLFDLGSFPKATAGIETYASLRSPHSPFQFEVHGFALLPQDGTVANRPWEGASFLALGAGARGCVFWGSALSLGPCAGPSLSWIRANGFGADDPASVDVWDISADSSIVTNLSVHPLALLRAHAGLVVPLRHREFVIQDGGQVFDRSALSFRLALGAAVRF